MTPFTLLATRRYRRQAVKLPAAVRRRLAARLAQLACAPSLRTCAVEGAAGDFGGKVFEAAVGAKVRLTWEFGPRKGEMTLRNIDDCLAGP